MCDGETNMQLNDFIRLMVLRAALNEPLKCTFECALCDLVTFKLTQTLQQ